MATQLIVDRTIIANCAPRDANTTRQVRTVHLPPLFVVSTAGKSTPAFAKSAFIGQAINPPKGNSHEPLLSALTLRRCTFFW